MYKNKGFTLIELIVVIAIVASLATATLAVLNPFGQFNKARDSRLKSDLSQIQKALESYYQDNNQYPASNNSYQIISGGNAVVWGAPWQPYMNIIPADAISGHKYVYYSPAGGQAYYLYANLNNSKDPQACSSGNACASLAGNGISSNACGGICNYGVTSPNTSP